MARSRTRSRKASRVSHGRSGGRDTTGAGRPAGAPAAAGWAAGWRRAARRRPAARQAIAQLLHAQHQLARVDGLRHVVVGADAQPGQAIVDGAAAGQEHQRDAGRVGMALELAGRGEAVLIRHLDVEQDDRRLASPAPGRRPRSPWSRRPTLKPARCRRRDIRKCWSSSSSAIRTVWRASTGTWRAAGAFDATVVAFLGERAPDLGEQPAGARPRRSSRRARAWRGSRARRRAARRGGTGWRRRGRPGDAPSAAGRPGRRGRRCRPPRSSPVRTSNRLGKLATKRRRPSSTTSCTSAGESAGRCHRGSGVPPDELGRRRRPWTGWRGARRPGLAAVVDRLRHKSA